MRKLKNTLFVFLFTPALATAASGLIQDEKGAPIKTGEQVVKFIEGLQNIALGISGAVIVAMIVYAGFLYITSGGNEDRLGKAKGTLTAAITGLVIILSAYAIINILVWTLGGTA